MPVNEQEPQTSACQFTALPGGIYHFTFTQSNNRAVDEWYQWQSYLKNKDTIASNHYILMLLDMRTSGPIPLLYALQKARDWRKQYPDISSFDVHIAFLFRRFGRFQEPYIKLVKDGVNIFTNSGVTVEVFFAEEQKAINWLLKT